MVGREHKARVKGLRDAGHVGNRAGQGAVSERVPAGRSSWELKGPRAVTGLGVQGKRELSARALRENG